MFAPPCFFYFVEKRDRKLLFFSRKMRYFEILKMGNVSKGYDKLGHSSDSVKNI
jgi:hypothetical protein